MERAAPVLGLTMSTACARVYNLPGLPGRPGADGDDGTNGKNSFTTTSAQFIMPAIGGTVTVPVLDSSWIVPSYDIGDPTEVAGHVIVVEFAGSFLAQSVPDATHVVLYNLGYPSNAPAATAIPVGSKVAAGGPRGESGTVAAGSLQAANNLADLTSVVTALSNLGLGDLAVLDLVTDLQFSGVLSVTHGGTGANTAAGARTALGLGGMATQDPGAVNIIGGSGAFGVLSGTNFTATTGQIGAFTNATSARFNGTTFTPPSAIQSLLAASAVSANASTIRVVGNGGAVTLTSTPTIAAPAIDGQRLRIRGTDNTNTVTFQDEGSLAGTKLQLGAGSRVLGLGDVLELEWDATSGFWWEVLFTDIP